MFWDGERWLPDQPRVVRAPRPPRPASRKRRRDWMATGVMALALIGLVVPIVSVSAVGGSGRTLLAKWSAASDISVLQESSSRLAYKGTWFTAYYPDYLKGAARSTDTAGSSVALGFRGAGISWIGPMGPTRGTAKVYVDGNLAATVNLYATQFRPTRVLYRKLWDTPASHRIRVVSMGTPGHPTVAVDAFVVRATTGASTQPVDDSGIRSARLRLTTPPRARSPVRRPPRRPIPRSSRRSTRPHRPRRRPRRRQRPRLCRRQRRSPPRHRPPCPRPRRRRSRRRPRPSGLPRRPRP